MERRFFLFVSFLLGCSLAGRVAFAIETSTTPAPQIAQTGLLQPGATVHATSSAPTRSPPAEDFSFQHQDRYRVGQLLKKNPPPSSGDKTVIPDTSESLGVPLPDPLNEIARQKSKPGGGLSIFRDTTVPVTSRQTGATSEPSTDQSGRNIFSTGNYHAEFSEDDGITWHGLDPFTIFGERGFCCDQVTVYDPAHKRQHWLLQYIPSILPLNTSKDPTVFNRNIEDHLVLANSPAGDFIDWCPFTIKPSDLGRRKRETLDFNDLVVGAHYLYLTTRIIEYKTNGYAVKALALLRFPLDELAACRPVHFDFVLRTDIGEEENGELRVAQGTTDIAYAGANAPRGGGRGRILRLLIWPESSKTVTTIDHPVPPFIYYTGRGPQCASEDKVVVNWCSDNPRMSATRGGGYVWFSWDAQQYGTKRPYPYTRLTQIRETDLAVVSSRDLYGLTVAHVQAAIAADRHGTIGLVDFFGGGKGRTHYFPSVMLAVLDQSRATSPVLDFFLFGRGVGCNDSEAPDFTSAWGDYHTIRRWQGRDRAWLAATFVRNDNIIAVCPDRGSSVTIKNVVFGLEQHYEPSTQ